MTREDYAKEVELIRQRHSVRVYKADKIEAEKVEKLNAKIKELNEQGNLNLQLIEDAGKTYSLLLNRTMGLGSAPSVIACVGPDGADLDERIGYYGEQLVLFAQSLGLNTCWTGMFNRKHVPAEIKEGEKLVICIAIGYGETAGKERKTKSMQDVTTVIGDKPQWLDFAVEMALLAPTAVNQQKFKITSENGEIKIEDKGGVMSQVDLGIVKYHFEVGMQAKKGD